MSPRFDRRKDQRSGPGGGKPPRGGGRFADDRSGGERRGDRFGGERFGSDRGDNRFGGEEAGGGRPGYRSGGRPGGRPAGRPEGRPGFRGGSSRPFSHRGEWRPDGEQRGGGGERRERFPRSEGRPDSRGEASSRPERRGPRPQGRPFLKGRSSDRFRDESQESGRDGYRPGGKGRFGGSRDEQSGGRKPFSRDRDQAKPIAVEVPVGEAERFNAYPADDLIWGRHAAQAALESGRPVHRIWCTPEMRFQPRFLQLLREAKSGGVLVEEVTWSRLGQLTNGAVHQGIVMQAAAADTLDLGTLIDGCRDLGEPPLLMALDGITDPHNLGAIVRSAEALGAHGLVLPQRRSAGLTGSVAKVAAGALEHLPVARVVNLNRALDSLKNEGYRVIGLAGEGSVALSEADLDGPLVVVTGSEGDGLSMLTRKHCDQLVRIPIRGATPSLNASVATAMVLYEVARRGWMKQISGAAPAPRIVRPQLPTPAPLELPEEGSAEATSAVPEDDIVLSPAEEARADQLVADVMAEFQGDSAAVVEQTDGADGTDPTATFSSDIKL